MNLQSTPNAPQTGTHEGQLLDRLFIGAGAMKAGTTWLYQVLDRHPDLFFSLEKEVHYFYAVHVNPSVLSEETRLRNVRDKYLRIDPAQSRATAVRQRLHWASNYLDAPIDDIWYRNLFIFRRNERFAADFSNLYALLPPEAWARITASVGELRVLYTMRHPVKRLWSHVKFHLQVTGQSAALDTWGPDDFRRFVRKPFIWENAEYGRALRSMKAGLTQGALLPAFHEEIHADERGFLAHLEGFLGIRAHDYPTDLLDRRVNETARREMPDFFADLVAPDVERIINEVRAEGLCPPKSWSN
ncbi:MAG: sulfotransferase [Pseudomonadota bacterium]